MIFIDFAVRTVGYLLSLYGLGSVAWMVTGRLLPTRIGLRVAATIAGYFVLNATLVQTLGLLEILYPLVYLGACTILFLFFRLLLFRRLRLGRTREELSLAGAVSRLWNLWVLRPPWEVGFLMVTFGAAVVANSAWVEGLDSLSLHGPLIVGWVQDHAIELLWRWNYPLCSEYQIAANLLLIGSDTLVVIPKVLSGTAMLLLVREVALGLRQPGLMAQLVSWMVVLTPVFWGRSGEGTLKPDGWFAVGILLAVCGLERAIRGRKGAGYLVLLALFVIVGAKATGLVYGGVVLSLFGITVWFRRGVALELHRVAMFVLWAGALLLSAGAVVWRNWWVHGSPVYPIELRLGPWVLFPGASLKGTSLLENVSVPGALSSLGHGIVTRFGLEFAALALLAVLGLAVESRRLVSRSRDGEAVLGWWSMLFLGTVALWGLFSVTPWSAGRSAGDIGYLLGGLSLRYALAPLVLTSLLGAAVLALSPFRAVASRGMALLLPALVVWKWRDTVRYWWTADGLHLIVGLGLLYFLLWGTDRWLRRGLRSEGRFVVKLVTWVAVVATLMAYSVWVEGLRGEHWGRSSSRTASMTGIWKHLHSETEGPLVIATNAQNPLYSYFLFGPRLGNRLLTVPELQGGRTAALPEGVDYVFLSLRPQQVGQHPMLVGRLAVRGWIVAEEAPTLEGTLLVRSSGGNGPKRR